jgi:hypothetical protein
VGFSTVENHRQLNITFIDHVKAIPHFTWVVCGRSNKNFFTSYISFGWKLMACQAAIQQFASLGNILLCLTPQTAYVRILENDFLASEDLGLFGRNSSGSSLG